MRAEKKQRTRMASQRPHHHRILRGLETARSGDAFDFSGATIEVARRLVGALIVRTIPPGQSDGGSRLTARIVETEAYLPFVDPACHAYRGPTARNASAFGRPGTAYVYFIYGNHYCLNVATEPPGVGAAVLIRAAEPLDGLAAMRRRRPDVEDAGLLSGPGNLCRAMAIDRREDGADLSSGDLRIVASRGKVPAVTSSARIGLSTATAWALRFFDARSASVSPYRRNRTTAAKYRASR